MTGGDEWVTLEVIDVPKESSPKSVRDAFFERHPDLMATPNEVRIDLLCNPGRQSVRFRVKA